jgi:hypothetical protein
MIGISFASYPPLYMATHGRKGKYWYVCMYVDYLTVEVYWGNKTFGCVSVQFLLCRVLHLSISFFSSYLGTALCGDQFTCRVNPKYKYYLHSVCDLTIKLHNRLLNSNCRLQM